MSYDHLVKTYENWENRMSNHGVGTMPFCIAFCGVFSSGKSSLLNALLNCGNVLPTGINPVTKIITRIRYGKSLTLQYVANGKTVSVPKTEMDAYITGKKELPYGCTELIMEMPSEILKNNVEFIDTPGYEDNSALEDMSRAAVLTADLIVFCCNATMLGKKFEKQYLSELSLTHGNFCMVVNRADSLNTDEDFEDVKRTAARLMNGRGNAAHPEKQQGHYFMTIAAGYYLNLNGFDDYIKKLLSSDFEKKTIRHSTNRCFTAYNKNRFLKELKEERADLTAEIKRLQNADNTAKERQELQKKSERMRLENKIENARVNADSLIRAAKSKIATRINSFYNPSSFVEDAKRVIRAEVSDLINSLSTYSARNGLMTSTKVSSALNQFLLCQVPEPTYRRVQRRGLFERAIKTISDTIFFETLSVDDGMEWVCNDYKAPAINKVNSHLENLSQKWRQLLNDYKSQQCRFTGSFTPNPRISQLQSEVTKLNELETRMNEKEKSIELVEMQDDPETLCKYLEGQVEKFSSNLLHRTKDSAARMKLEEMVTAWKNGSLPIVVEHGYACGSYTLIKALLGGDAFPDDCELGSYPTLRIIPSQKKENVIALNTTSQQKVEINLNDLIAPNSSKLSSIRPDEIQIFSRYSGFGTPMISLIDNGACLNQDHHHYGNVSQKNRSRASAIILVIDAARAFSIEDRNYLRTIDNSCRDRLFVVINRMNIVSPKDMPSLKRVVRSQLQNVFVTSNGEFDQDLFNQRVFFVDSYNALNLQEENGEAYCSLEQTGLPDLKEALKNYVYTTAQVKLSFIPIYKTLCEIYERNRYEYAVFASSYANMNLDNIRKCLFEDQVTSVNQPVSSTSHNPAKTGNRTSTQETSISMFEKGIVFHNQKNYRQATIWFKKAADEGHSAAQFFLGRYCEEGLSTKQSMEDAIYWYNRAASNGNPAAREKLKMLKLKK